MVITLSLLGRLLVCVCGWYLHYIGPNYPKTTTYGGAAEARERRPCAIRLSLRVYMDWSCGVRASLAVLISTMEAALRLGGTGPREEAAAAEHEQKLQSRIVDINGGLPG